MKKLNAKNAAQLVKIAFDNNFSFKKKKKKRMLKK